MKEKILRILSKLKRIIYGTIVGTTIHRAIIAIAEFIIIVYVVAEYRNAKNDVADNALKQISATASECALQINSHYNKNTIACSGLAAALSSIKDNEIKIDINRNTVTSIVKNVLATLPDAENLGVYWEWNIFDGKDDALKDHPLYKKWYGRFVTFFAKTDSSIINDLKFEVDEKQYETVRKTKNITTFSPENKTINGKKKMVLPIYIPILNNEEFLGCVITYINIDFINQLCQNVKDSIKFPMNMSIFDNNSTMIASTQIKNCIGKKISETIGKEFENQDIFINNFYQTKSDTTYNYAEIINVDQNNTKWALIYITKEKYIMTSVKDRVKNAIILGIWIMLIVTIASIFLGYRIGEPIKLILNYCRQLNEGNLNIKCNFKLLFNNEVTFLYNAFDTMTKRIRSIIEEVKKSSASINSSGKQLAKSAAMMASGANQQASASEQVSAAMEDMTTGIKKNSENSQQTDKITKKVVQSVLIANKSVSQTVDAMRTITERVSVINEIAGKTDLLAVNAAIEAARAGESGKGFAVVASEIRKLAEKSQAAAKEIDQLSEVGVRQAENSGKLLEILVPEINKTSNLVQEITASSIEQNNNAIQINNALQQLNDITQQNAATAEQLATGAEESQSQAENLDSIMAYFHFGDNAETELSELNKKAADILKRIADLKNSI